MYKQYPFQSLTEKLRWDCAIEESKHVPMWCLNTLRLSVVCEYLSVVIHQSIYGSSKYEVWSCVCETKITHLNIIFVLISYFAPIFTFMFCNSGVHQIIMGSFFPVISVHHFIGINSSQKEGHEVQYCLQCCCFYTRLNFSLCCDIVDICKTCTKCFGVRILEFGFDVCVADLEPESNKCWSVTAKRSQPSPVLSPQSWIKCNMKYWACDFCRAFTDAVNSFFYNGSQNRNNTQHSHRSAQLQHNTFGQSMFGNVSVTSLLHLIWGNLWFMHCNNRYTPLLEKHKRYQYSY